MYKSVTTINLVENDKNSKPEDLKIFCRSCQKEFLWSAKEQEYYQKKGFRKKPQRCNKCREKTNQLRNETMFYIHCGLCDKDGKMLNPPPKDRVAICEDCFKKLSLES